MRPHHTRLRLIAATAVISLFAALGLASPAAASPVPSSPRPAADTNLAAGKPITASSHVYDFVETNANDDNVGTYWESASGAYPATLSVDLGAKAVISSVVIKLNPDPIWAARTQTIAVLGRATHSGGYTTLVGAKSYSFDPNNGANTVTIPVSATVADVQLTFTSNSGAPGGQVGELQVMGSPAPAPDLTIGDMSWTPSSPVETDAVTLKATVKNIGTAASDATNVNFYLAGQKAGTASVPAIAAGASASVSASVGTRTAGTYQLVGKVDESDTVLELNENNNTYTNPASLVVSPVASSDLVASSVSWTPGNPASGDNVSFSVTVKNQGTVASGSGSHGITLSLLDANNAVVKSFTGSVSGTIAAGATAAPVTLGSWTAVNGKYTVKTVLANDPNELPVKQANNTSTTPFFVGRGANMPYDAYEAEDGVLAGGATIVGPNRTIGDLAGEASGRRAVKLASTGASVEFTTKASTNTLVTRFAMPDASGGGGINSTLDVYVNGTFLKAIDLTSHFAWLYGDETSPNNSPSSTPRHIYDEAHAMLGTTVPAGSRIRLQKDAANTAAYYSIDFIDTEQVSPIANPDPSKYTVPAGFTQQDVQNALDKARQDPSLVGVYLPAGTYQTSSKLQVYGKAIKMVGAGPWYTQFQAPTGQENTDVGIRADSSANGSTFSGFAYFGNYTSRIDGPGKVFDLQNVANDTIDDIWVEHMVCMYWGNNTDHMTITNDRIRDTFADGVNMTNGSSDNLVSNDEARSTGDDSFALFAATDSGGTGEKNNTYQNLTAILPWRAAGVAVYGGQDNTVKNVYIADTLTYSGITISSLDFGYPMEDFGPDPTNFGNISIVRAGGHFWGAQTFPGIWMFSASKQFRAIRVSDVDIIDPTYSGIMFQTDYSGGRPLNPVTDTVLTNITISGAHKSGDAYDAKSGFGIWANELPESGQGPAVGSATFNNLRLSDNAVDIRNTTSTFTINVQ
ncbi:CARDB domain-containing protein [Actinoallomurus iriomotensis]|uniref:Glycosyl hydrolase n=1 Tax=Actinoallomurus iriomotensis TaxID=478107 RepID=A0A9W6SBC9_9ACTN|nr:CARDB domain-containing protein [Actinoallomurus iriomotensis]GLY91740.1 glycosyl hydrolase [Actinoallomurus iriomotensis]